MRINSGKQSEASRRNGAKSNGPKSPAGKQSMRHNAIKDALYARDVVVERAGESVEEFEQFRKTIWDTLKPMPIAEIFVDDFVKNWWRRERVRRAEALRLQWETTTLRAQLQLADEFEKSRSRFVLILLKKLSETPSEALEPLESELENLRIQLSATSLGMNLLRGFFEEVENDVSLTGKFSKKALTITGACFGLSSGFTASCIDADTTDISKLRAMVNERECATNNSKNRHRTTRRVDDDVNSRNPSEKDQRGKSIRVNEKDDETVRKEALLEAIRSGAQYLSEKQSLLRNIEERETRVRKAAAQMLPDAGSDRFSRAETMYDRRMHRAFMMYVAAQKMALSGSNPPELPA